METALQTKTQEILNHHVSAFIETDVNEIMKDFTEESELLTPDGAVKGMNAIRSFFEEILALKCHILRARRFRPWQAKANGSALFRD